MCVYDYSTLLFASITLVSVKFVGHCWQSDKLMVLTKLSCFGCCHCAVVGFICNIVRPLFTEWHRLLASSLSLLLLDNLQANLHRWQSVGADNVSLLTAADSSDDSSPSNADQSDRRLLSVSSEIAQGSHHASHSDGSGDCIQCGPQTENVLRRASLPPLSASTSVARVADRRGSSPVIGSHHISCRRVCFLSSLAEYPAPLSPLKTCREQLTADNDMEISKFDDKLNNVCHSDHKDVIPADSNVCMSGSKSKPCSVLVDDTVRFSEKDSTPDMYTDELAYYAGSNGASLNGVSLMLPKSKFAGMRRASAPAVHCAELPPACAARRGSAPSPGAEMVAVSLWTSKVSFDAKPFSAMHCQKPSVVVVESPHLNVGVDQLDFFYVVTANSSLKVPLEPNAERCRKKRSHSAHAVIISPARFVERRYSSPVSLHHCWNASNLIHQSPPMNNFTPFSISGLICIVEFLLLFIFIDVVPKTIIMNFV